MPAPAAAAKPFPEDGTRRHEPPFGLGELTGERCRLAGRSHADGDQGGKEIRRNRKPRALRDVVHAAHKFEAAPGAHHPLEERREALARALHTRRHDARRDRRRLQQPEIVAGKVKHLGEVGDLHRGAEIDTREPQHWLIDHPQKGFDGRLRCRVTAVHGKVDRHVEHAGSLGKVHTEKEDVAPAGVGEIHPHRRRFTEHGIHSRAALPG